MGWAMETIPSPNGAKERDEGSTKHGATVEDHSMKALNDLRRFILAKSSSEEVHEVREYVQENIAELAPAVFWRPSASANGSSAIFARKLAPKQRKLRSMRWRPWFGGKRTRRTWTSFPSSRPP